MNKIFLTYDKIDKIPVRDHLYLLVDKEFQRQLYEKEKILFSCWVNVCTSWLTVLHKKKKLVVTSEQVFLLSSKNSEVY